MEVVQKEKTSGFKKGFVDEKKIEENKNFGKEEI